MIKVLKNVDIYSPKHIGKKDVLVIGDKISRIEDKIDDYDNIKDAEIFDFEGKILVPGYIDMHVHITGGGGEQGPASRVPESKLTDFTSNGITTVVGLLGTDGITRSIENLVAKARALTEEGITVFTLTSAYGYPPITFTGSVEKDIIMIPPMIGVKVAVSDHRSSNPNGEALTSLAVEARRGGMLANVAGLVVMHMGNGKKGLKPIFDILDNSDVPAKNLLPTHMLRTKELMDDGVELVRRGGYIDLTVGSTDENLEINSDKIINLLNQDGVSADHMTISTDAFGSQPRFDENGSCIGLTYASPGYLHKMVKKLVEKGIKLEEALKLATSTPAELLMQSGKKGCIKAGADADLLILDKNLEIDSLFAKGMTAIFEKSICMKGRFEI